MEGLDIHQRGLVEGFFPGVAEGVVHPKPMGFTRILLATQPSDRPDGSKRLDQVRFSGGGGAAGPCACISPLGFRGGAGA